METKASAISNQNAKELAILIYDFLMEERCKKPHLARRVKVNIDQAVDLLEQVYKIKFTDYVTLKAQYPLRDIFTIGCHPIKVKNRIAAEVHKKKGNKFMDKQIFNLAEIEYSMAIQLNPRNAIYFCNRAASRIRQSSFFPAVVDCNKSLQLDKNYTKAYIWLGLAHALMDHPAKAVRCYRKALRLEPDNEVCIANMDLINRKLNRITFKVLEPLYRYSRNLARMAANLANKPLFARRKNFERGYSKDLENRNEPLNLVKYSLGTLD